MSTKFDWSQFKNVESKEKPQQFDWSQFETMGQEKQSKLLPKLGLGKESSEESKIPEMQRTLGRTGKVVGTIVAGIPGDVASQIGSGLNWLAKRVPFGKPKSEEELKQITENPFTSESIKKGIEKVVPSLKPINEEEKDWEENLGLLTSLAIPFPGGKTKAVNPKTRNALYQAGKRLGMSEKDLTPLLHGKISENILGKLSNKSKEAAKSLSLTREALGDVYETLKNRGASVGKISGKIASELGEDLGKFRYSLTRTLAASPEKQNMINFLEKAQENVMNFGASPEDLINFWQDINRSVNWKALEGGKKVLANAKHFVEKALTKTNPSLARDFKDANKLWAKSSQVLKAIGPKKFEEFIDATAYTALAGALVTGNVGYAKKIALTMAGKKALGSVATKLLTDPKWQNLNGKLLQAIKNNR